MARRAKAIAMISGGLDSTLALALVRRQGIEVKAVNFYTGLCITETQRRKGGRPDGTVPRNEALRAAAPDQFAWRPPPYEYEPEKLPFDILAGSSILREQIERGEPARNIARSWEADVLRFEEIRGRFLMY